MPVDSHAPKMIAKVDSHFEIVDSHAEKVDSHFEKVDSHADKSNNIIIIIKQNKKKHDNNKNQFLIFATFRRVRTNVPRFVGLVI